MSPNLQPARLGSLPSRLRTSLSNSTIFTSALVFLLVLAVANSAAATAWTSGMGVVSLVALAGVLTTLCLTLFVARPQLALLTNLLFAFLVTGLAVSAQLHVDHPRNPSSLLAPFTWSLHLLSGSAYNDPTLGLYLLCWSLWIMASWLTWCVLRWHRALLGLSPALAFFAINLLTFPTGQNAYSLAVLFLTLLLLLWNNYTASTLSAKAHHVKLTGDATWDFFESGIVALAVLLLLGIMLPPLSTTDQTTSFFHFDNGSGRGPGGFGTSSVGFATEVSLGGPLAQNQQVVFTYTLSGNYVSSRYFRGVNVTDPNGSEWHTALFSTSKTHLTPNSLVPYSEAYQKLALASFNIQMQSPPLGHADLLFYPGQLEKIDRNSTVAQAVVPLSRDGSLITLDLLSSYSPSTSRGGYIATVAYSTASKDDLQVASKEYPGWITPYTNLPPHYRSPKTQDRIRALALQITAGTSNFYDQASAIESYLRTNYTYTLTPPAPPEGQDALEYFLFTSKQGYCQYFATAMGDLLRSLGIPTRLVNGFGPGEFDTQTGRYVVRSLDAHTWVEVYFPTYGWILFEPTPDGVYSPPSRGTLGLNLCLRDNLCDNPATLGAAGAGTATKPSPRTRPDQQAPGAIPIPTNFRLPLPDLATLLKAALVFFVLLFLFCLALWYYLHPKKTMQIWRRTLALAKLAGASSSPGATPLETGRTLAHHFPALAPSFYQLSEGFALAAYAPLPQAATSSVELRQAWSTLRSRLLLYILSRLFKRH